MAGIAVLVVVVVANQPPSPLSVITPSGNAGAAFRVCTCGGRSAAFQKLFATGVPTTPGPVITANSRPWGLR